MCHFILNSGDWAPEQLIEETIAARAESMEVRGAGGSRIRMVKVGKVKAGRILDGSTWDQFPIQTLSAA